MTAWVRTSSPAAQFRLNSDLLTSWELWAAALLWPASASCTIRIISARRLFPLLQFFLQKHPLGRSRLPFLTAEIIFNSTFWPVFFFDQTVRMENVAKGMRTTARRLFWFQSFQRFCNLQQGFVPLQPTERQWGPTLRFGEQIRIQLQFVWAGKWEIFSLFCFWTIF